MDKLFIECDCYSEGIAIDEDISDDYIYLTYWKHGFSHKPRFIDKLKHIWNIIRYGHPYTDILIFDSKKARAIANKLFELANKIDYKGEQTLEFPNPGLEPEIGQDLYYNITTGNISLDKTIKIGIVTEFNKDKIKILSLIKPIDMNGE